MSFIDQNSLISHPGFQAQVRIAMVTAALAIVGEAPADPPNLALDQKRHDLGVEVLNNVAGHEERFRLAVAANPAISSGSSDNDVQFTVNQVWNDIAGVTGAESPPQP